MLLWEWLAALYPSYRVTKVFYLCSSSYWFSTLLLWLLAGTPPIHLITRHLPTQREGPSNEQGHYHLAAFFWCLTARHAAVVRMMASKDHRLFINVCHHREEGNQDRLMFRVKVQEWSFWPCPATGQSISLVQPDSYTSGGGGVRVWLRKTSSQLTTKCSQSRARCFARAFEGFCKLWAHILCLLICRNESLQFAEVIIYGSEPLASKLPVPWVLYGLLSIWAVCM